MSANSHSIYAFDFSKDSTGFCFIEVYRKDKLLPWELRRISSGSIRQPASTDHYSKHYHVAVREMQKAILAEMEGFSKVKPSFIEENLEFFRDTEFSHSVAIEYPIFNNTSSPLQFFIHQSMVAFFEDQNCDVVGYSTGMVKSFAAALSGEKAKMGGTDKKEMGRLYASISPKVPLLPQTTTTPDEVDAIFIALLAAMAQADALSLLWEGKTPDPIAQYENEITRAIFPDIIFAGIGQLFFENPEVVRKTFLERGCRPFAGLINEAIAKDFTKKFKTNGHLSLEESKMFYPYKLMGQATYYLGYMVQTAQDPKALYAKLADKSSLPKITFSQNTKAAVLDRQPRKLYTSFGKGWFLGTPYNTQKVQ